MSDEQFTKLSKDMQREFAKVHTEFSKIYTKLDTKADNDLILKLYQHMEGQLGKVDAKLDATRGELKEEINRIYSLLDKDLKQRETDEQERLVMGHQLTRHETWIKQLAHIVKTKLVPKS